MSTERVIEQADVEQDAAPVDPRSEDFEVVEDLAINRDPGSGSLTREQGWVVETEAEGMNDGRYDTRTTFYSWDTDTVGPSQRDRPPEKQRTWAELAKWNDGMWEPDRSVQNFDADVRRWTQTFCNQLELPNYQYERVQYVVNDIDLTEFRSNRFSAEKIILGVISLVVDSETTTDDPEGWDLENWIVYDDSFEKLMIAVDMAEDGEPKRDTLWEIRKIVHSETDYFSDE